MVKVAAIQSNASLYKPDRNRKVLRNEILRAIDVGARLVVLPELAVSGYGLDEDGLRASAEPLNGPTLADWSELASQHGIWITGGFCEIEEGKLYNTAILVGPGGLVGHYRKLHLFDGEKAVFTPGDKGLHVYGTEIGAIGLCVCYDLRFVEVARALALQGADIIAVPTAWVGGFDPNPRDAMGFIGQARGAMVQANLNQVYMVCASQGGRAGSTRFLGSTMIVDPFGDVSAGPMGEPTEGFVTADVLTERLSGARIRSDRIRPREDRRTDTYALRVGEKAY